MSSASLAAQEPRQQTGLQLTLLAVIALVPLLIILAIILADFAPGLERDDGEFQRF